MNIEITYVCEQTLNYLKARAEEESSTLASAARRSALEVARSKDKLKAATKLRYIPVKDRHNVRITTRMLGVQGNRKQLADGVETIRAVTKRGDQDALSRMLRIAAGV